MGKYTVVVHYEGAIDYTIDANSEDEAKRIAENMFGDESPPIISSEITDCFICDCREEK